VHSSLHINQQLSLRVLGTLCEPTKNEVRRTMTKQKSEMFFEQKMSFIFYCIFFEKINNKEKI
jgi:hypothetical protein